MFYVFWVTSI